MGTQLDVANKMWLRGLTGDLNLAPRGAGVHGVW